MMLSHDDVVTMVKDYAKFYYWSPGYISELKPVC